MKNLYLLLFALSSYSLAAMDNQPNVNNVTHSNITHEQYTDQVVVPLLLLKHASIYSNTDWDKITIINIFKAPDGVSSQNTKDTFRLLASILQGEKPLITPHDAELGDRYKISEIHGTAMDYNVTI